MFLVTRGWSANDIYEWRIRKWRLFANLLTSEQEFLILSKPYVMLFLTCSYSADRGTVGVYDGSVDCVIVTLRKQLLWRYFDRFS